MAEDDKVKQDRLNRNSYHGWVKFAACAGTLLSVIGYLSESCGYSQAEIVKTNGKYMGLIFPTLAYLKMNPEEISPDSATSARAPITPLWLGISSLWAGMYFASNSNLTESLNSISSAVQNYSLTDLVSSGFSILKDVGGYASFGFGALSLLDHSTATIKKQSSAPATPSAPAAAPAATATTAGTTSSTSSGINFTEKISGYMGDAFWAVVNKPNGYLLLATLAGYGVGAGSNWLQGYLPNITAGATKFVSWLGKGVGHLGFAGLVTSTAGHFVAGNPPTNTAGDRGFKVGCGGLMAAVLAGAYAVYSLVGGAGTSKSNTYQNKPKAAASSTRAPSKTSAAPPRANPVNKNITIDDLFTN